jgi:hypothetical protein
MVRLTYLLVAAGLVMMADGCAHHGAALKGAGEVIRWPDVIEWRTLVLGSGETAKVDCGKYNLYLTPVIDQNAQMTKTIKLGLKVTDQGNNTLAASTQIINLSELTDVVLGKTFEGKYKGFVEVMIGGNLEGTEKIKLNVYAVSL